MTELVPWAASTAPVRQLWFGRSAIWAADQIAEIAVIWFTWSLTGSSVMVGLIAFAVRSPFWIFGWLAGVVADRHSPIRVLVLTNALGAAIALSLPLLHVAQLLNFPLLVACTFLLSLMKTLEMPALVGIVPMVVQTDEIRRLNTVLDNAKRLGRLVGQGAASVLQAIVPAPALFVVVTAALAWMAWVARGLVLARPAAPSTRRSLGADLRAGWAALRAEPALLALVACFALYNIAYATAYYVLLPRLFGSDAEGGGTMYGIAVAAFGLGSLLSNIVLPHSRRSTERTIFASFLWLGLWFSALAFEPPTAVALLLVHIAGWAIPAMDIGMSSMVNERIAMGDQGKVFVFFRYLAECGMGAGLLIGGWLTDSMGSQVALIAIPVYLVVLVGACWTGLVRTNLKRAALP
jgi:MFS family permease